MINTRSISIIEPGPLATVQDRGRYGYRSWGVPLSGAMDFQALRIANRLCGNDETAAAIEITMGGFRAEFQCQAHFALCGPVTACWLNGTPVNSWQAHHANSGDLIRVEYSKTAFRNYLTVSGGIDLPPVMGSRSTYLRGGFGGLEGRALRAGDKLPLGTPAGRAKDALDLSRLIPRYSAEPTLRAILGPQDERVSNSGKADFFSNWFSVTTRADRMGIALSGPVLELPYGADIISDGACPGAVQVHGNRQPTILGMDCQTAGGYVKVSTLISADLPLVAQLAPGDRVRFEAISLWEAREIYMRNEFLIRSLLK